MQSSRNLYLRRVMGEGCLGGLGNERELPTMLFWTSNFPEATLLQNRIGISCETGGMFGREVATEKHIPWQPMAAIQCVNCGPTMSWPLAFHTASTAMQSYSITDHVFFFLLVQTCFPKIEPGPWFIKEKVNDFLWKYMHIIYVYL